MRHDDSFEPATFPRRAESIFVCGFIRLWGFFSLAVVNFSLKSQLPPSYRSERDKKKLERLVISNALSAKQKKPRLERFIKFLDGDREAFDHNIIQLVYANRVSILDLSTKKGIIIENDTFAAFQKTIFKALYKRL
jgi:hypothetical protein